MMPRAEALEKLRRHHAYVVKKRKLEKAKKVALEAGRQAQEAAIEIDRCCAAVEATSDPAQHREDLAKALTASSQAIAALAVVYPMTDPSGWLEVSLNENPLVAWARGRELRLSAAFDGFLSSLGNSLEELGFSDAAKDCIVQQLGRMALPESPALDPSAKTVLAAGDLMGDELRALRAGGSRVSAWDRARAAQDVVEGGVVLFAPMLVDKSSPLRAAADNAPACLAVISGAALLNQACTKIVEDDL
jgi:hypothetical protein